MYNAIYQNRRKVIPTYDYNCDNCGFEQEIMHQMSDSTKRKCPECKKNMTKQIGMGYLIVSGIKPTLADHKESEHKKKVKDPERAVRMRKKAFGHESVGNPSMQTDPKHLIKGRTLGGQEKEVDKKEFIQAAAKDPAMVKTAQEALKKSGNKK